MMPPQQKNRRYWKEDDFARWSSDSVAIPRRYVNEAMKDLALHLAPLETSIELHELREMMHSHPENTCAVFNAAILEHWRNRRVAIYSIHESGIQVWDNGFGGADEVEAKWERHFVRAKPLLTSWWQSIAGESASAPVSAKAEVPSSGTDEFLQLIVDNLNRTVSRANLKTESVDLSRRAKLWELFHYLFKARENGNTLDELKDELWPNSGSDSTPNKNKQNLNVLLEVLKIEVAADRRGLWRLAELRSP